MISSVSHTDVNAAQEYEFTFRHGGTVLARFSGTSTEFLIGTDPSCDILLEIEGVAPRHARLRLNGGVFLTNLDDEVGTYVNGLEISGEWELRPLQSITFGDAEGELRLEAPNAEAVARAGKAAEEAAVKAAEEAAVKAAEEAAAKAADEAAAKAAEEATVKAAEEAAVKAAEEAAVKAAEDAAAKAAKKAAAKSGGKAPKPPKLPTAKAAKRAAAKAAKKAAVQSAVEPAPKALEEAVSKPAEEAVTGVGEINSKIEEPPTGDTATSWEEPKATDGSNWSEAILRGAAKPRGSELFDMPPMAGSEVSVQWEREVPKAAEKPESASFKSADAAVQDSKALDRSTETSKEVPGSSATPIAAPPDSTELESEVARLKVELAAAKFRSSRVPAKTQQGPVLPDQSSFLSLTNGFLLKKLAATTDAKKEVGELTKELKKRELALVEAWSRRQAAEERCLELSQQLNQKGGASRVSSHRGINRKLLWTGVMAIAVGAVMFAGNFRATKHRAQHAEAVVNLLKSVAPQLHREAESALVDGREEEALAKIERALALEPNKAAYHLTLGHVYESLLRIPQAEVAYARAVALAPSLAEAHANLELCRRISATRDGVRKVENLYGLHRVMLEQRRLTEALRMARHIVGDSLILHRTWEAILQAGGIRGDLRLNEDGTFDLDLMVGTNADLSALRDLPLRSLKAARANISDLEPLSGMPLRHLDISETMVRDISVLRGMPLETLNLSSTAVTNLVPLRKMPLQMLGLDFTSVADVSDLRGLPLQSLSLQGTKVQSIAGLAQMPLRTLNVARTGIKDLSALKHAPMEVLNLEGTAVTDLTPLKGAPLKSLTLSSTRVVSLEPLRGMPLRELKLVGCESIGSLAPLGACFDLERLVLPRRGMDLTPLQGLGRLRFLSYETQAGGKEEAAPETPSLPLEAEVRQTSR